MGAPLSPADLLALVRKDPLTAFVSIPIVAMRAGTPRQEIRLKSHSIALPMWTGAEWSWYGNAALATVTRLIPGKERKAIKARDKLATLDVAMRALGGTVAVPEVVAPYYDAAVRTVIAAIAMLGKPTVGELVLTSLPTSPEDVRRGYGDVLDAGADALRAIGRKAKELARAVWGEAGIYILAALAAYVWWDSRKRGRGRREAE